MCMDYKFLEAMKTSFISKAGSNVPSARKVHKVNTVKTPQGNGYPIPITRLEKINATLWDKTTVI